MTKLGSNWRPNYFRRNQEKSPNFFTPHSFAHDNFFIFPNSSKKRIDKITLLVLLDAPVLIQLNAIKIYFISILREESLQLLPKKNPRPSKANSGSNSDVQKLPLWSPREIFCDNALWTLEERRKHPLVGIII